MESLLASRDSVVSCRNRPRIAALVFASTLLGAGELSAQSSGSGGAVVTGSNGVSVSTGSVTSVTAGGVTVSGGSVSGGHHRHHHGSGGFPYYPQPFFIIAPVPYPVYPLEPVAGQTPGGGLMLPPPTALPAPAAQPPARRVAVRRPDANRSSELITLGDRLFRASNFKKSEERYNQAARADPNSAAPYVRLAQLALVRSQFAKAAELFRLAQTIEPGWVVNAPDIQRVYGEPTDFAKVITKLETQVQAHPDDRDAWLALGAELFLSGRTQRAADIFKRLNDRKPDEMLEAFLDASRPSAEPK